MCTSMDTLVGVYVGIIEGVEESGSTVTLTVSSRSCRIDADLLSDFADRAVWR